MPFQSDTGPGFRSPPGTLWASEICLKTSLSGHKRTERVKSGEGVFVLMITGGR